MKAIYSVLLVFLISSCREDQDINTMIGTWKCTHYSTPTGSIVDYKKDFLITFMNENDFNYSYFDFDIKNDFYGRYFINYNQNRINKTLVLIPNILKSGQDTIRLECLNFDIIKLSDLSMIVCKPTRFIDRVDNGKKIRYNEMLYFTKVAK